MALYDKLHILKLNLQDLRNVAVRRARRFVDRLTYGEPATHVAAPAGCHNGHHIPDENVVLGWDLQTDKPIVGGNYATITQPVWNPDKERYHSGKNGSPSDGFQDCKACNDEVKCGQAWCFSKPGDFNTRAISNWETITSTKICKVCRCVYKV